MHMHEEFGFVLGSGRANFTLLILGLATWLRRGSVTNLHEAFGLAALFSPIVALSVAVRARDALTVAPTCGRHVQKIEAALSQKNAPLRHQWRDRQLGSTALRLHDASVAFSKFGVVRGGRLADETICEAASGKGGHLQAALLNISEPHIAPALALELVIRP